MVWKTKVLYVLGLHWSLQDAQTPRDQIYYVSGPLKGAEVPKKAKYRVHWDEKVSERFADFLYKTAFLKSKFKDDPVRVQLHNVPHFKGLE